MKLYHGTTHSLDEFSLHRANKDNHLGSGVYLTSCEDDGRNNYAGVGPDLRSRINVMIDELTGCDEDYGDWQSAKIEATQQLDGGARLLLTCEIEPTANLFKLGNNYVELYSYDEENDEIIVSPLMEAIQYYLPDDWQQITADCDEIKSKDLIKSIFMYNNYDEDYDEDLTARIIKRAGFDGVEYEDAFDWFPWLVRRNTRHFVVYKPQLVRIIEKESTED